MFHTTVLPGESLFDAICRAGVEANRGGFNGYTIDCDKCGMSLDNDHTALECAIARGEF